MRLHAWSEPLPPQAKTVELTAQFFKLIAALMSRSCCARQPGQVHVLIANDSVSSLYPHAEHSLLLANQRAATTTDPPCCAAL